MKAVRSFKLKEAFPNMESHPYDWRVDPYEPQRVWFTIRSTAKHTGPLHFAGATYKATNKVSPCDTPSQIATHSKHMRCTHFRIWPPSFKACAHKHQ